MSDKRNETRIGIKLDVELRSEGKETSLQTRDLSNGGVYLEKGETQLPLEGSIVELRIKQSFGEGEAPVVTARVVRVDEDGIALQFISDE